MAADSLKPEKIMHSLLKAIVHSPAIPVYHVSMPDGQVNPCITYQRIATSFDHILTGKKTQLSRVIFQVDAWADTDILAGEIATKIHLALDGLNQGVAEGAALVIMAINDVTFFEADEKTHRRSMNFRVTVKEYTS
ncbi:DUF3168 domain-containing protein [Candidatus Dependentiae bacterium]|nr:MAG: DUF3168 domain-containing protein [Candidatus Dependentiae bacterium]